MKHCLYWIFCWHKRHRKVQWQTANNVASTKRTRCRRDNSWSDCVKRKTNDAIIQINIMTFVFIHKHTVHEVRTGRWDIISIATWCGGRGVMERGGNNKQESLYCGGNAIIRRDVTRHSSWCHPSTPRGHKTSLVSAHCCPIWVMMSMSFIKINFTSPTYKNINV